MAPCQNRLWTVSDKFKISEARYFSRNAPRHPKGKQKGLSRNWAQTCYVGTQCFGRRKLLPDSPEILLLPMAYTFVRVSAATAMKVDDYFVQGRMNSETPGVFHLVEPTLAAPAKG
jgi:hypothetical protein